MIKRYSEVYLVNEKLIGKVVNIFKKIWTQSLKEIEKISNDPNSVKDYLLKSILNLKNSRNLFSDLIKEFKNLESANDQACLSFIENILDRESGLLGKQGIGILFNNKDFQGEVFKSKRLMMEFIINTVRDKVVKEIKYQYDQNKRNIKLSDTSYLPDLKKILQNCKKDDVKKKSETLKYVESSLIPKIIVGVKSLREEDIRSSLSKQGVNLESPYKIGDDVRYKKDTFDDKKEVDDQPENIAIGEIKKIEGDMFTIYNSNIDKEIKKSKDDLIGKDSAPDEKGQEEERLSKILTKLKSDKPKMATVARFSEFIMNNDNKDKVQEIDKIINPE